VVKTSANRRSNALADEILGGLVDREVFTHPFAERALFLPGLDKVTLADCQAALRRAFAATGHFAMVRGNTTIPGEANAIIAAAFEKSHATAVGAPAAQAESVWAYANWGVPGKVVQREHVADLDVELVSFANGVKLNIKKTDFEAGGIRTGVRVGSGTITEPVGQRGLAALAGGTFGAGGLGKHSVDDLLRLLGRQKCRRGVPAGQRCL
jgi:zinc protease